MVEKKEAYISISSSPTQRKYGPFSSKDGPLYSEPSLANVSGCLARTRTIRTLRRIFLWTTCTVLGLHFLNKQYNQVSQDTDICSATYKDSLEYPKSFPSSIEQMILDMHIYRLARAYGKEFFGQCYRPDRDAMYEYRTTGHGSASPALNAFSGSPPTHRPESDFTKYAAPSTSTVPDEAYYSADPTAYSVAVYENEKPRESFVYDEDTTTGTPDLFQARRVAEKQFVSGKWASPITRDPTPMLINTKETTMSFSAFEYTDLLINSGDGIEVIVEILHAAQAPQVATVNNNSATVYLLPHDPLDYENDISEFVRIVKIPYGFVHAAGIEIVRRSSDDDSKVKCRLQVILPPALELINQDEPKASLRTYHVSIKEGQVRARGITADLITATIGRGSVEFSSIEVYSMIVAVLDGRIHLPGVKFTRSLTAGVIRGSSTVLAKLQHSGLGYCLINMCTDGYTYTDAMTSPDTIDRLAANFYIYRDTGGPTQDSYEPMIRLPGDIYTGDDELAYLDEHSTDVNKTGYLVSKGSESKILVYSGAKTVESRAIKSRFLYGFYSESPR